MSVGLRILLLGPPGVYSGDEPLALSRRGLRSMLFYLSSQPEPQTRGQLGLLFWEDLPEAKMRKNLRELLSRLRRELPDAEMLRSEQEYVWLDGEKVRSDLRDFLELYAQAAQQFARIPSSTPLPDSTRELSRRALALWRAKRFTPGEDLAGTNELETWAGQIGRRLNAALRHLLERIADHEYLVGRVDSALDHIRAALDNDPLDDVINLRHLNLLVRSGRVTEAAAACQTVLELYATSGIEVSADVQAASERIRALAGRLSADTGGSQVRQSLQLPLIGRQRELESLRLSFQQRVPVVLLGEAGAGKSRLLHAFAETMRPTARVFTAAAVSLGSGVPLQPLADMLRSSLSVDDWRALPDSWTTILALLLPELAILIPEISPPLTNSSLNQPLLFEAIYQVLRITAEKQPLVVLLDNAQWCDETTLDALRFLVEKRLFDQVAFLAVAAREEEQQPALTRFLRRFDGGSSIRRIHVSPLAQEHIHEFARMVFGDPVPEAFTTRLQRETGGNPLYLLETLRAILEYSPDSLAAVSSGKIPLADSVQSLVRERLHRLSPEAHTTLSLAAVIGSDFSLEILETAGSVKAEAMVFVLEELERAALICYPAAAGPGRGGTGLQAAAPEKFTRYQFVQEQVREILLMDMSPARRRFNHLRVAEALKDLETAVPEAQFAILAAHYQQAGEVQLAFGHWLKAARYARRLYSMTEQELACRQAETILERDENAIGSGQLFELYAGWIEMGTTQANVEITRKAAEKLHYYGWRRENQEMIRAGFLGLAAAADLGERADEGMNLLDQVRPFLEAGGSLRNWMAYHTRRGFFWIVKGRMDEAVRELETAMDLVRKVEDNLEVIEARANCAYRLSGAQLMNGWPEKALATGEEALADSRKVMSHASAARTISMMAWANYYLGRYEVAQEQNDMSLRMAFPMQNQRLIGLIRVNIAQGALVAGQIDEGWEQAKQSLQTGESAGFTRVTAQSYRVQADCFQILAAYAESIPLYRQSVEIGGLSYAGLDALHRLGLALVFSGQAEEGLDAIERCITLSAEGGTGLVLLPARGAKAIALGHLGREEEALRLAEEVAMEAVKRNLPYLRAMPLSLLAQGALREGRPADARPKALAMAQHGRQIKHVFMELSGYVLARQAGDQQPAVRDRLRELMAQILANTREPVLRPHVERLYARFSPLVE